MAVGSPQHYDTELNTDKMQKLSYMTSERWLAEIQIYLSLPRSRHQAYLCLCLAAALDLCSSIRA
jgi:hypothetical protein